MKSEIFLKIMTIPAQPEEREWAAISDTIQAPGNMKKAETISDWHLGVGKYAGEKDHAVEKEYFKTAYDGAKCQISCISMAQGVHGDIVSMTQGCGGEARLLDWFVESVNVLLDGDNPYFIGHNISGYDLKILFQRLLVNGVNPGIVFPLDDDEKYFDTMKQWDPKGHISLCNLANALGVQWSDILSEGPEYHYLRFKDGDMSSAQIHCQEWISVVQRVYLAFLEGGRVC